MEQEIRTDLLGSASRIVWKQIEKDRSAYYIAKRILDLTITLSALILVLPFMLLIAALIRLDSAGPVLFVQDRIGARRRVRNGRAGWEILAFPFLKFRTMVQDADPALHQEYIKAFIHNNQEAMAEVQGERTPVRKLVHDPRVTRVGNLLRKSSLDELPQLWNVLRGDMSLVGPRPAIPYEVEEYEPWHLRRLEAIPGITGLWQTRARSSVDFDEMVKLDIEYIEKQSLWLDLRILLKTPLAVAAGKGAA
jgi:lipopolysaccharide/colanic/teichoic acid biosynthesis glycosyltransferase